MCEGEVIADYLDTFFAQLDPNRQLFPDRISTPILRIDFVGI